MADGTGTSPLLASIAKNPTGLVGQPISVPIGFVDNDLLAGTLSVTVSANGGTLQPGASAGTISGAGSATLHITGSLAAVNGDLAQLTFTGSSAGSNAIQLTASDSDHNALSASTSVTLQSIAIALSAPTSLAATVGAAAALSLAFKDPDPSAGTVTAVIHAGAGSVASGGSLGTITGSNSANISIAGTQSQVSADLQSITYIGGPAAGTDTISVSVSDSDQNSATKSVPVVITATAPAANPLLASIPRSLSALPGTAASLQMAAADKDALASSLQAVLSAGGGTLSCSGSQGTIGGNASGSLTISGSVAQVNADLLLLSYTGRSAGNDTITVSLSDNDQNTLSGTVPVTIGTPPTTGGSGAKLLVTAPASLSATPGNTASLQLGFSDSDSLAGTITALVHATVGTLATSGTGGSISGNGSTSLSITGTASQVNGDLQALAYTAQNAGSDSIAFKVADSDHNAATASVAVSLPPLTPAAGGRIQLCALPNVTATTATATAVPAAVTDSDKLAGTITVVASATNGTLATGGSDGTIAGSNTGSLTISGSQSQIDNDLKLMTYTGKANGSDTVTILVTDSDQNSATKSVAVTNGTGPSAHIQFSAPTSVSGYAGSAIPLSLAFSDNDSLAGTLTAGFKAVNGIVSTHATIPGISGNGTDTMTVTGSFAQIQALYADISLTPTVAGTGALSIGIIDSDQNAASRTFAFTAAGTLKPDAHGTIAGFDPNVGQPIDLTGTPVGVNLGTVYGDNMITVGGAGASITAASGNDMITIGADATGPTSFAGLTGNHTINAVAGTNTLLGGTGNNMFSVTGGSSLLAVSAGNNMLSTAGGNHTLFGGAGNDTLSTAGSGTQLVACGTGNETVSAGAATTLLFTGGGADSINLSSGAGSVLASQGSSTVTGGSGTSFIDVAGGSHMLNLGSGNSSVLAAAGNATVTGGSATTLAVLAGGHANYTTGTGLNEVIIQPGGSHTITAASGGGPSLILGYDPSMVKLAIPTHINGANFTDPSQIPQQHDASGNTTLQLGSQAIMLLGVSSLDPHSLTLV